MAGDGLATAGEAGRLRPFSVAAAVIEGIVVVGAQTDASFGRHTHDDFGFGLIETGGQVSASGRGRVEAGPGHIITVNPGEVHDGHAIRGEMRRWRMLYIDPERMHRIASDVREREGATFEFTDPVIADQYLAAAFPLLVSAISGETACAMAAEARLLSLVARLLGRTPVADAPSGTTAIARQRIDDDPAAFLTLQHLAADTGLSRFQFLRAFARETGLTPHAYIVQKRLGLARRMILRGMTLGEAAVASGFADQSHMTRLFVRNFGFTPGGLASAAWPPAISFKTAYPPV